MVEMRGFESPDSRYNGDEGIRTPDLRRAKAALFQLSYVPPKRRFAT